MKRTACFILTSLLLGGIPVACGSTSGRIAFDSQRDGNHEIYVMNADGSGQMNLTSNPAQDGSPAWSP